MYDAGGQRYAVEQVTVAGLATLLVVAEVRLNVVVQVALLELFYVWFQRRVGEELFVCCDCGEDLIDGRADGALASHDAYHRAGVTFQFLVLVSDEDALTIESVQSVSNDADDIVRRVRYPLTIVFCKLSDGLVFGFCVETILWIVESQQAVALGFHQFVALVDGKVEWCREVSVAPMSVLLYLDVCAVVAR